MHTLLQARKGLVIDGQWKANPEDENEIQPTAPIHTLLENARRMPEVVVVLNCKEEVSVARMLTDSEEDLKLEFEQKMQKREEDIKKQRDEAREEKLKELEEQEHDEDMSPEDIEALKKKEMEAWEEEKDAEEKENDENDEDKPDLDKMKDELADKIKE